MNLDPMRTNKREKLLGRLGEHKGGLGSDWTEQDSKPLGERGVWCSSGKTKERKFGQGCGTAGGGTIAADKKRLGEGVQIR